MEGLSRRHINAPEGKAAAEAFDAEGHHGRLGMLSSHYVSERRASGTGAVNRYTGATAELL